MSLKNNLSDELLVDGFVKAVTSSPTDKIIFPVAKNIIDWSYGREFLGGMTIPHCGQFEILRDFFELLCPNCNVDKDVSCWMKSSEELLSQVLLERGICTKCGVTRIDLYKQGKLNCYDEAALCIGMRAGKSMTVGAFLGTYVLHRALSIDNLSGMLGLAQKQRLEMAFAAVSGDQAAATIWSNFSTAFDKSPWFQDYVKHILTQYKKPEDKKHKKKGKDEYIPFKKSTKQIAFYDKNIIAVSLHSNSASLAGPTRLFSAIDEIAKFDSSNSGSKRSANEVYTILKNSLATVQKRILSALEQQIDNPEVVDALEQLALDPPPAIMASISSPLSNTDKIMQLIDLGRRSKKLYTRKFATWEFNPVYTRESFSSDFAADPIRANRDFGAEPPSARSPYFPEEAANKCFSDSMVSPRLIIRPVYFDQYVDDVVTKYVSCEITSCIPERNREKLYFICADAGKRNDSYAICLGHTELFEGLSGFVVDALIEVSPKANPSDPREVFFPGVVDLIQSLCINFPVQLVRFDRWDSTLTIQQLKLQKIPVIDLNVKLKEFQRFREILTAGLLKVPFPSGDLKQDSYTRCLTQLIHLEDRGDKIPQPPTTSAGDDVVTHDDLVQVLVGCCGLALGDASKEVQKTIDQTQMSQKLLGFGSVHHNASARRKGRNSNAPTAYKERAKAQLKKKVDDRIKRLMGEG